MKIEVKLKDPRKCEGCPCLGIEGDMEHSMCGKEYFIGDEWVMAHSEIKRPQKCIDENGL